MHSGLHAKGCRAALAKPSVCAKLSWGCMVRGGSIHRAKGREHNTVEDIDGRLAIVSCSDAFLGLFCPGVLLSGRTTMLGASMMGRLGAPMLVTAH